MSTSDTRTIVVFGDSITEAAVEMPEPMRWPILLQAGLRAGMPDRSVIVVNAGVGGNTSREGLARMDRDVMIHHPDIVLVEFGNDATLEPERHVPVDEYRANLAAIKARLDAAGKCIMVPMTFPPCIDAIHSSYEQCKPLGGQDFLQEPYRRAIRDFAGEWRLPMFDLDRVIRADRSAFILSDGVHLTAAGNRAFADALLPFLTGVINAG